MSQCLQRWKCKAMELKRKVYAESQETKPNAIFDDFGIADDDLSDLSDTDEENDGMIDGNNVDGKTSSLPPATTNTATNAIETKRARRSWTKHEDGLLIKSFAKFMKSKSKRHFDKVKNSDWETIANEIPDRSTDACSRHWTCDSMVRRRQLFFGTSEEEEENNSEDNESVDETKSKRTSSHKVNNLSQYNKTPLMDRRLWSEEESNILAATVQQIVGSVDVTVSANDWHQISKLMQTRTDLQCAQRWKCKTMQNLLFKKDNSHPSCRTTRNKGLKKTKVKSQKTQPAVVKSTTHFEATPNSSSFEITDDDSVNEENNSKNHPTKKKKARHNHVTGYVKRWTTLEDLDLIHAVNFFPTLSLYHKKTVTKVAAIPGRSLYQCYQRLKSVEMKEKLRLYNLRRHFNVLKEYIAPISFDSSTNGSVEPDSAVDTEAESVSSVDDVFKLSVLKKKQSALTLKNSSDDDTTKFHFLTLVADSLLCKGNVVDSTTEAHEKTKNVKIRSNSNVSATNSNSSQTCNENNTTKIARNIWTTNEDDMLLTAVKLIDPMQSETNAKWTMIAKQMPDRSKFQVIQHWSTKSMMAKRKLHGMMMMESVVTVGNTITPLTTVNNTEPNDNTASKELK
jgi:hypothetical protein